MALPRASDWINILAFAWFVALALRRRGLGPARRKRIVAIGAGGLGITLGSLVILPLMAGPRAVSISRDWIPYILLLMFYWQSGQFVTRADVEVEARLAELDRRVAAPPLLWCARHASAIMAYLELAYLLCYVSMPLGLGALYLLGGRPAAGRFWTVVLLSTYPCYALLPFVQTRPPRSLGEKWSAPLLSGRMHAFNEWILRHGSIHANTIPSAHVASTTACALVLLRLDPAWVGLIFLLVALSIALGAVAGRYHYGADVVLGGILATVVFLGETALG